jgi:acylglycerol lipase
MTDQFGRESFFQTSTGDQALLRTWEADSDVRASVLIIHGYGEHSGRYGHVARALNEIGVTAHAYDIRGMGQSAGRRGRIDSVEELDRDLNGLASTVLDAHKPAYLLGHSFGGLLAARHLLYLGHLYRGAIFSAPAFLPRPVLPTWLHWAPRNLAKLLPSMPAMTIRRRYLSRDDAVVAEARRDPLNTGRIVDLKTGWEFSEAGRRTLELIDSITIPLLVMQGSDDRVVDPRGGYCLYERAASEDKTLMLFEGGYHEPLNDTIRDDAVRCVVEWIGERIENDPAESTESG